eukprot:6162977-Pyramimonas_sp.AAC.1
MGEIPYGKIASDEAVAERVARGERLPRGRCPQPVYQLMCRCWAEQPSGRPTFSEVLSVLADMSGDASLPHQASA